MADDENFPALLRVAVEAARQAGELIHENVTQDLQIGYKEQGVQNLVTEMDTAAETLIKEIITGALGESIFLGEEFGGNDALDELTWVIDPIDGTVNYAHGVPIYCVSIAAVKNGAPVVGAIFNPNTGEMFTAISGGGAYLNDVPMRVSEIDELRRAILVTGFPYNVYENPYGCIDTFADFVRLGTPVRRLGSAALDLAYVAAGRFDGYWEVSLNPWDVAAGALMVVEAGGRVTTYAEQPTGSIIITSRLLATNGRIDRPMLDILRRRNVTG